MRLWRQHACFLSLNGRDELDEHPSALVLVFCLLFFFFCFLLFLFADALVRKTYQVVADCLSRRVILLTVHGAVTGAHRMLVKAHRDRPFQFFSCGSLVRVCQFCTFCSKLLCPALLICAGSCIRCCDSRKHHVHKCLSSSGRHADGERGRESQRDTSPYHQSIGFPIALARSFVDIG